MDQREKFKALVHYICSKRSTAPDTLGAVKLNKILWLSDLSAFYETGKAITSSRYIKQEYGPVPARIVPALKELERGEYFTCEMRIILANKRRNT